MFTGLVETLGTVSSQGQDIFIITLIKHNISSILSDLAIGDSVAVDGICLTVEEILPTGFVATTSPETLERSTLGKRQQAANYVNLETSLRVGSKIGGHFVTGHVDGIGCLIESVATDKAWQMSFGVASAYKEQWQRYIAPYLIPKGSIAVNGISLTIADCDRLGNWFTVAVIPHTYQETNLCYLQPGNLVNLESDILGKYVAKLLKYPLPQDLREREDISLAFLTENGYL